MSMLMSRGGLPALLLLVVATAIAASAGATFEPGAWYAALAKPSWNPPNAVFAPVWTVLYLAIAIAGWRAWRVARRFDAVMQLWAAQLVLNTLWSWLFFGLHRPDLALIDILLLLGSIIGFILMARSHDAIASWLFVPYALWVGFATSLNIAIWQLNG